MNSYCVSCRLVILGMFVLSTASGCGDPETETLKPTDQSATAVDTALTESSERAVPVADSALSSDLQKTPQSRRQDEVWEDEDGNRFIGRVPYDVFFDHPLAVASNEQPVVGMQVATTNSTPSRERTTPTDTTVPVSTPPMVAFPSDNGWPSVLPATALESEVKTIRNFLNQKLQSVGNYNSAVTMIPVKSATIALLAGIAVEHSADVSWKEDAPYIRDLAASMNDSVLQRGPKDQRRLLGLFENLADTLNRSRPSGLAEPDPETTLSDVAAMKLVMVRMDEAEQRLRTEVNESSFASSKEIVLHEASILSGLMQAMTTESYGYADDPEFKGMAQKITDSGQQMRDAADGGNFADFELSLSRIAGSCQACHREYKSN